MISTAYYPYLVDDKSSARRAALQPHIYSPPESHNSPRNTMYPHLHSSGSPSPGFIYSAYEQYHSKDSWVATPPTSWPTFYPPPLRLSSLSETAINPRVTIHPPQPVLVSDIDTPSSISSHSILTPSSPFAPHDDVGEAEFQAMDFDEFDYDDEDDCADSDFADDMEGIDEEPSPFYGASAPHVIKSTSALEGALGDTPSLSYGTNLGVPSPADRRLSASVPGYPSRSSVANATRDPCTEKTRSPGPMTSPPSVPGISYPPQHMYTQRSYSSSFAMASPSLYNHIPSSSSLAGAFASSLPLAHQSRTASNPLPILQPQPIRPIPPIPLFHLASSANEFGSPESSTRPSHPPRTLSPLPLLCQPVSDAIRYRLKESPTSGALDGICFDGGNTSGPMCEDFIATTEGDRFTQGLAFCQQHQTTSGSCPVEEKVYSCGCVDLPMRWQ